MIADCKARCTPRFYIGFDRIRQQAIEEDLLIMSTRHTPVLLEDTRLQIFLAGTNYQHRKHGIDSKTSNHISSLHTIHKSTLKAGFKT